MRRFFGTNVFVYLFDASAPRKKTRAQKLLKQTVSEDLALLSTQVLHEFFVAGARKLSVPLPHEQAERAVRDLGTLPISQTDAGMIMKAITTMHRYRLSFWNSLIIQAALRGGATIIYTEDLHHYQVIETFSIENPFDA
jgi:predicted nucleic acid-binding protein